MVTFASSPGFGAAGTNRNEDRGRSTDLSSDLLVLRQDLD